MSSEQLSTVQRLLVIQGDAAAAIAVETLQQHRPDLTLIVVTVKADLGSTVGYALAGEVPLLVYDNAPQVTIEWIRDRHVDAVLVLTERGRSPYAWAYRAYLAGVPIRIGISGEFGGQVLSHCIAPPDVSILDPHLYLLQTSGLVSRETEAMLPKV